MVTDQLDELLHDRFDLSRADLIAALKTLPAQRPWAAALTEDEARLLDDAGLVEDPQAYAEIAADVLARTARLISTAYSGSEVAHGLGVNDSRIRQRRLAHTLWAIDDDGAWVYPAVQFDRFTGDGHPTLKQVRGLDRVLPALLATGRHPAAVAGFLMRPQHELRLDGRPRAVRDWLHSGGAVEPVLALVELGQWAGG